MLYFRRLNLSPNAQVAALGAFAVALVALAAWIVLRVVHSSPEKMEQKRRLWVNRNGRLGDALITEANETTLYYAYSIHGVRYTASQEISSIAQLLPSEPGRLVGVANLKYAVNNPANSILLCEEWSGLRVKGPAPSTSLQSQTASDAESRPA
jgi:hypothetical protein